MNDEAVAKSTDVRIQIAGYRILREVGRGGIATVYQAVQESLQREVALKVMSPALTADASFTDRFLHEGRTIAQLNHPGIVTIYDISVDGFHHYIAMEYLKGGSLKQRVRSPLSADEALDVLHQIASALAYAHEKSIVHRDVKPENIMFRDDGGGEAVLTDFGIAKSREEDVQLTSDGMVVGTPRYMSPEQAEGKSATPRSDIYALGIILYEMLVGRAPYAGKETLAVLYSHINDPIPQLPDRYLYLQSLFEEMLAKDPGDRIASCSELLERLEVFRDKTTEVEVVAAAPAAGQPMPLRWLTGPGAVRRYLLGSVAALGVILLAFAFFGRAPDAPSPVEMTVNELPEGEPPVVIVPRKIDLTAETDVAAVQPGTPDDESVDIAALLDLADKQVRADRLSTPVGNNALDTYRAILKIQPGNADAERGLRDIANRYEQLARARLRAGKAAQADAMIRSGLSVQPDHAGLLDLSGVVRAELARQAARESTPGSGDGAPIDKYVKALAEESYAEAQFQTALAFAQGDGVERDLDTAVEWLRKAVTAGHAEAQYNLALGLLFGPEPDPPEAGRLMQSLAEREYKPAYRVLGWMYTTGTGQRKKVKQAVRWSAKASWGDSTHPDAVITPWQQRFDEEYEKTVAEVSDQKLRLPQNLK